MDTILGEREKMFVRWGVYILFLLIVFTAVLAAYDVVGRVQSGPTSYRTVSVSVEAKTKAVPDKAYISFSVEGRGDTQAAASRQSTGLFKKLYEVMGVAGVEKEDIYLASSYTSGNSGFPEGDYQDTKNVYVKLEEKDPVKLSQKISQVMKAGEEAGFVPGSGYGSCLTFSDQDGALSAAREEAIVKAKEKAKGIAKAMDKKIGGINSFSENSNFTSYNPTYGGMCAAVPTQDMEIVAQEVAASVSITFDLK
ncbi:MAG: DUF541 domain-containing protein [Candidatus Harrisonbacteria bacterium]|nr:DUF541 domain-containing protein [Candidatus Harrisonbacteria bacterium]